MPAGALTARIIGLFAVIGLGLGGATLLFLWATGFFEPSQEEGFEAIGQALVGGVALGAVLVFTLLVGVVLAALGGVYAANAAQSPAAAVGVGGLAGGIGYVALATHGFRVTSSPRSAWLKATDSTALPWRMVRGARPTAPISSRTR